MPSALETLVKILKLERKQGYKNNAVIGGLAAYGRNWQEDAHKQARRPEHHLLVDELSDLLRTYEHIENKDERHNTVTYMMDRITGRVPPPPEYQAPEPPADESTLTETTRADAPAPDREPDPPAQREEPPRQERPRPESRERSEQRRERPPRKEQAPPRGESRRGDSARDRDRQRGGRKPGDGIEGVDEGYDAPGGRAPRTRPDIPPLPRLARPPRRPRPQLDPDEAADIMAGLSAPVTSVKGVGPRMAKALDKLGVGTINDLLFYLPRRYDDYTNLSYIARLRPETTVTVVGTVRQTEVRVGRSGRRDFYLEIDDGSGVLSVIFFGQHFLVRQIRRGKQLVLSGRASIFGHRMQMTNPEWEELDTENLHTTGIVPVYPLTELLRARALRRLMKSAVDYWADRLPDYVPEPVLDRAELADLGWAIRNLHFPEGFDHLDHARRRFVFDQLLLLQLSILANRRDWQAVPGQPLPVADDFVEPFIQAVFPYELTAAQRRAIEDIRRDIDSDRPMNRLLQGDVGSGKTAVAVTALAMAFANGKQSALMAPTSILAEQHYRGLTATLEAMPGERKPVVALLTSALTNSERESVYNGLADGSIDIVVGTHALIQGGVEFNDLALAVIDEQHRFGVGQRSQLRSKGRNPHLLVMTATPIPRTLALTLYADLDLSVMDEMPPGRIPIQTRVVLPVERERIYGFIEAQIKEGRQAFVVYPLVETSDKIEAQSATEAYEKLSRVFFRYRVGLLHGRMKPAEKDDIMAAFADHQFDVLVTTSVAEVGVDIPNASVMVIEGANRFGLAQLHQFRGRVGRGQHASYCLLIPDSDTPEAQERLLAMQDTTDGFKLAEIDWKMRGPGDLVGTRQSGQAALQLAEFITPELVELAQREARTIYEEDPYLSQDEHRLLAQRVQMLYHEESDVS
jgi:ATP-dependent DNA helicase RecG